MKKYFIYILFLLSSLTALAQVGDSRRDFSVGVSGGYLLNKVGFMHPAIKQDFKTAPQYGVALRYVCEKYFKTICALQVGFNYQDLGWKELIEDGTNDQYTRHMNYITMPVLMQMGWGKEIKGLKFLFEAGPQFGYMLNDKEEKQIESFLTEYERPSYAAHIHADKGGIHNRFDYGITAGLGVEYSSPFGHFLLGARYYYGLSDFFDTSKKGDFGRACHNTISFHLTYLFDLVHTKK